MATEAATSVHKVGPEITLATVGPSVIVEVAISTMTPHQLYDEIEWRITERSVYGRDWTPEYRRWWNGEIRKYKRELYLRDLPGRRWLYDAQCEAEDAKDSASTRTDTRYSGVP